MADVTEKYLIVKFDTLSMRMTEAPKSDSSMPQNGAGASPASSITRTPARAIIMLSLNTLSNNT